MRARERERERVHEQTLLCNAIPKAYMPGPPVQTEQ